MTASLASLLLVSAALANVSEAIFHHGKVDVAFFAAPAGVVSDSQCTSYANANKPKVTDGNWKTNQDLLKVPMSCSNVGRERGFENTSCLPLIFCTMD